MSFPLWQSPFGTVPDTTRTPSPPVVAAAGTPRSRSERRNRRSRSSTYLQQTATVRLLTRILREPPRHPTPVVRMDLRSFQPISEKSNGHGRYPQVVGQKKHTFTCSTGHMTPIKPKRPPAGIYSTGDAAYSPQASSRLTQEPFYRAGRIIRHSRSVNTVCPGLTCTVILGFWSPQVTRIRRSSCNHTRPGC